MLSTTNALRALAIAMMFLSGCFTTEGTVKRKRPPEEFILPPSDDNRFCSYPTYPKETMNNGRIKAEKEKEGITMPGFPKQPGMPASTSVTGF